MKCQRVTEGKLDFVCLCWLIFGCDSYNLVTLFSNIRLVIPIFKIAFLLRIAPTYYSVVNIYQNQGLRVERAYMSENFTGIK
jgi:hypothetical protein